MKKIVLVGLLFGVSNVSLAATLKITNKTKAPIFVRVHEQGVAKAKEYAIGPNSSQSHNSFTRNIRQIDWYDNSVGNYGREYETACSNPGWKIGLNMPWANVAGTLNIKEKGTFDSSRLGNNKQAEVTGPAFPQWYCIRD